MALTQTTCPWPPSLTAPKGLPRLMPSEPSAALDEVVLEELCNAQKTRIGGLVQLTVRVQPAQKKRKGRNPATGEEIEDRRQARQR